MIAALLAAGAARAGTSPVNVLAKPASPRVVALGGASAGLGGDPTVAWSNPAAGASDGAAVAILSGGRGAFGDASGFAGWAGPRYGGTLLAGLQYFDAGSARLNASDGSVVDLPLQRDVMASGGVARELTDAAGLGMMAKVFYSRLLGTKSAGGAVLDFAAHVRPDPAWTAGIAVQNVGMRLRYAGDRIVPPAIARLGAAWRFDASEWLPATGLLAAADAEYLLTEGSPGLRAGVEASWRRVLALRAGVHRGGRAELSSWTCGAGFRVGRLRLDYAVELGSLFDRPQTLSLTLGL